MATKFLCFLLVCIAPALAAQDLSVFELFTDHAVLQRDVEHPIWGWDRRGRSITITVDGQSVKTKTERDGRWNASLPPMPAGGPHTLTISDGRSEIRLEDVYFGDVYLLSGQSNMEWKLSQSDPDSTRARTIADPLIRQILVSKTYSDAPENHLALDEAWKPGVANEIADFSGVGAYFAHYLREGGVEVPIGLVHSSWGGSRIEPWISAEALGIDPTQIAEDRRAEHERVNQKAVEFYASEFGDGTPPKTDKGRDLGYLNDRIDFDGWATAPLPGTWESRGYDNVDGVFYYRRTFELTEAQATGAATLFLGPIDDGDETFINGKQVGITPNAYSEHREYSVPAGILRPGENTLAVRVYDGGGGGGFTGSAESMYLETSAGKVPLAGTYHYRIGEFSTQSASRANQTPTLLYNAMIAPLQNLPLTGVLWYQGESNAGPDDAEAYADRMRTLVTSWRKRFEREELPFYWVQLANFRAPPTGPDEPGWAILRNSQTAALDLPGTGQAVITDIGEADDIHPKNKWEVGRRLSLHALQNIYGKDVQASSPVAVNLEINGSTATVRFDEVGSGLTVVGDSTRYPLVKSLTVRNARGEWQWAVGVLNQKKGTLTVVNPDGEEITAVRYAWFDNPDDANLFSKEGLPVTPFELLAN
ncbi:sialate O-acetylesterase [Lewinella aquimaris]|uniref:Sialate O-acetylesterase n=1 Tax=Neolewinella aquimaris TaxID=1835722 RepID=A0A840E6E7_9BACT|nr:sialate O-acetylesterase [Neolewinella aquimaris]MBB4077678.1 sialate O-acetylesterase [Neolewinella aquimaris]